jgi:hypothetical protein
MDSILGHCLARATIASVGGWDAAVEQFEAGELKVNAWLGVKVTPKASRVATFIVLWSVAMLEEDRDEYSITEYQRYWNESERHAYRVQNEFRELWPEFETPNELASQIVKQVDRRTAKRDAAKLPMVLQVEA